MNQRNVEALHKAISDVMSEVVFDGEESKPYRMARELASRGVLGPASEVLTNEEAERVWNASGDSINWEYTFTDLEEFTQGLESIAKGETP
jgi:hypothetical protein